PAGPDGNWPCLAVRTAIEQLASADIERHLQTAVFNKRGAHFRAPGGEQERALATKFQGYAEHVRMSWPRTAALLAGIAENYKHFGRHQDKAAELDEFE